MQLGHFNDPELYFITYSVKTAFFGNSCEIFGHLPNCLVRKIWNCDNASAQFICEEIFFLNFMQKLN